MDEMRREIIRSNIQRYQRLLEKETDESKRATLLNLLAEARSEARLMTAERILEQPGKEGGDLLRDARQWQMKAEECRTIADGCQSAAARSTYLQLARDYDTLAQRAEARAAGRNEPEPKAG